MPKANITLPDNTKIIIEGSEAEVRKLLTVYSGRDKKGATSVKGKSKKKKSKTVSKKPRKQTNTPTTLVRKLINEGFFDDKRNINEVQERLRSLGHVLEEEALGSPLLRLTRQRELSREKGADGWVYKQGEIK